MTATYSIVKLCKEISARIYLASEAKPEAGNGWQERLPHDATPKELNSSKYRTSDWHEFKTGPVHCLTSPVVEIRLRGQAFKCRVTQGGLYASPSLVFRTLMMLFFRSIDCDFSHQFACVNFGRRQWTHSRSTLVSCRYGFDYVCKKLKRSQQWGDQCT